MTRHPCKDRGRGFRKLSKRRKVRKDIDQRKDTTSLVRGVLRAPAEKNVHHVAERPCPSCKDPTTEPCPTCQECPACCSCEDLEMALYDNEVSRWNRGEPLKPWNG